MQRMLLAMTLLVGCATSRADTKQEPLIAPSSENTSSEREAEDPAAESSPPKSEIHALTPTGTLSKQEIRAVIRDARSKIRSCYEQELRNDSTLEGRIKIRFIIRSDGTVADGAEVTEATLDNLAVQSCLLSRIENLVFPEPKGGGMVAVNYPFNFSSAD